MKIFQHTKRIFLLSFLVFSCSVFAANPSQPFLPSDNVQDPNCTPLDSNCYVRLTSFTNETVTGLDYSTSTGVLSLTPGYNIPTTASTTAWDSAIGALGGSALIQNGNSFGTTLTLGTNDSQALAFETNGATAMTILANGNVGVGANTPGAKLSVQGSGSGNILSIASSTGADILTVSAAGKVGVGISSALGKLQVEGGSIYANAPQSDTVINGGAGNAWQTYANLVGSAGLWAIRTATNASINFDTNNNFSPITALTILTNGRIGIGNTNPTNMLDVVGTTSVGISYSNTSGHALISVNGADASQAGYYIYKNGAEKAQIAVLGSSNDLSFSMAGTERLKILAGGNVGIGTTTPSAKLAVTGSGTGSGVAFRIANSSNANRFSVLDDGTINFGQGLANLTSNASNASILTSGNAQINFGPENISVNANNTGTLSLGTGGTARLTILNGGNVGIGTTTPIALLSLPQGTTAANGINFGDGTVNLYRASAGVLKTDGNFDVTGNIGALASLNVSGNIFNRSLGAGAPYLLLNGTSVNVLNGDTTKVNLTVKGAAGQTADLFQAASSSGTVFVNVTSGGNVGIGTTTAGSVLTIKSTTANGGSLSVGNIPVAPGATAATIATPNSTNEALTLYGQSGQSSTIFSIRDYLGSSYFGVSPAGGNMSGAWSLGGGGSFTISTGSTGDDLLRLGNVAAGGKNYYIGSRSDGSFRIKDNSSSTDRFVIDTNGGVTLGNGLIFDSTRRIFGTGTITYQSNANSSSVQHQFTNQIGTSLTGTLMQLDTAGATLNAGTKLLNITGDGNLNVLTALSSGNVGIGTTNPATRLAVNSGTTNVNTQIDGTSLSFTRTVDGSATAYIKRTGTNGLMEIQGYDGVIFRTNGSETERMRIDTTGNVGIGTTNPGSALEVAGTTGLSWTANSSSSGLATIGSATGGSLFVRTPAVNSGFSAGLGVDGTYAGGISVVNLSAYGTKASGIYGSALAFNTTNGTSLIERMRIDTNGNVGIGTTTPSVKLHISSSNSEIGRFEYLGGNSAGITIYQNGSQKGTVGTGDYVVSGGSNSDFGIQSPGALIFGAGGTTERFKISSSGNVGIGTTTPATKLSVYGTTRLDGNVTIGNSGILNLDPAGLGYIAAAGGSTFSMNTQEYFVLNRRGTTFGMLGTGLSGGQGSYLLDNFAIGTTTIGSKFVVQGSGSTSGSSAMNITDSLGTSLLFARNDGNVGIGTTTPTEKLSVAGNINLTGALKANGSAGTLGSVLQSTGTGIQWVATSSLGISAGASGSGTVNLGDSGQLAFYAANSTTTLSGTSTLVASNGSSLRVTTASSAGIGLIVKGSASQSADLLQAQDSSGGVKLTVASDGSLGSAGTISAGTGFVFSGNAAFGSITRDNGGTASLTITPQNFAGAHMIIQIGNAASSFLVKAAASQTASIQEWRNSGGTALAVVNASGSFGIGTSTPSQKLDVWGNLNVGTSSAGTLFVNSGTGSVGINNVAPGAGLQINASGAAAIGQIIKGASSQTADFLQAQDSGGSVKMYIGSDGSVISNGNVAGAAHLFGASAAFGSFSRSSGTAELSITTQNAASANFGIQFGNAANTFWVKAASSQTGNMQEWRNSAGNALAIVTASGSFGIGTTTPADKLQVAGDIRVGTSGANGCIKDFSGTGITGTCSSDERLKTNVVDLSDGYLDKMANLRVITYNWNDIAREINKVDTSTTNYGLLAQNVESIFPELVTTDSNGYKQVNYSRLPLYLLKSVQELSKKFEKVYAWFANDKFNVQNDVCVDDYCVTKAQFKQILINAQNPQPNIQSSYTPSPIVTPPEPVPEPTPEPTPEVTPPAEEPAPAPTE